MSLQPAVSLPLVVDNSFASRPSDEVYWLRVLPPETSWRGQHPKIWQLVHEFDICVLERLRQASLAGNVDFVLATRTSCSNGLRVITGHCYLSPAFSDLAQLELYLGEYLVDLLHMHFFGDPKIEQSIAFG
ncbi:MAG TPA: hypothetical protein PKD17_13260 [Cellvibrionaceae bacterium]|nr:hypothetical protein [Cellvibrionaceae bacterium]HMW72790.1 hypothetical protein [Cellvibrionaceae bacterium]HMY40679.1 hypothetical protein [Marinagarivorans sp.]HNG58399.1 hypothetical protein [Cellvibrionaceae bacterium]